MARRSRLIAPLRAATAIVGTLPVALLAGAVVARFAPVAEGARFMLGATLVAPLWVAAMCFAFLTRSPARFWGGCVTLSAAMGAVAYFV